MPDDTTESVAEQSFRLQPSINLHAPFTALKYSMAGMGIEPTTFALLARRSNQLS